MSYFLLGLFKLRQKYADGQNDPERFSISSAFPMAGLGLLRAVFSAPDYELHATIQHNSLSTWAAFGVN